MCRDKPAGGSGRLQLATFSRKAPTEGFHVLNNHLFCEACLCVLSCVCRSSTAPSHSRYRRYTILPVEEPLAYYGISRSNIGIRTRTVPYLRRTSSHLHIASIRRPQENLRQHHAARCILFTRDSNIIREKRGIEMSVSSSNDIHKSLFLGHVSWFRRCSIYTHRRWYTWSWRGKSRLAKITGGCRFPSRHYHDSSEQSGVAYFQYGKLLP